MTERSMISVYLKLLLTAFFWGGTFIAGRVVTQYSAPFPAAFLRFAIAAIFLLIFTWKMERGFPRVQKHQILPLLLLGMTGVFAYNFFFFKGLQYVEASRASVIVANNPIFIALFSAIFFHEKLTPLKILGILLSVSGAMVVITRGHLLDIFQGGIGVGEVLIFGCVVSWVSYSLIGKVVMKGLSPLVSVTYSVLVGTTLLFIPAYMQGLTRQIGAYPVTVWFGLFFLGFFGTVLGFLWFYQGILHIGPTKAGLFINFVPISAITLSFFILGEPITLSLLVGVILVSTGVYLTNRKTALETKAT